MNPLMIMTAMQALQGLGQRQAPQMIAPGQGVAQMQRENPLQKAMALGQMFGAGSDMFGGGGGGNLAQAGAQAGVSPMGLKQAMASDPYAMESYMQYFS